MNVRLPAGVVVLFLAQSAQADEVLRCTQHETEIVTGSPQCPQPSQDRLPAGTGYLSTRREEIRNYFTSVRPDAWMSTARWSMRAASGQWRSSRAVRSSANALALNLWIMLGPPSAGGE